MNRNQSLPAPGRRVRAILLGALVGVTIGGIVLLGGRGDALAGGPRPSERPSAPASTPPPSPSPEPIDGGGDAIPVKVDLETLTPHDVYVDIVDRSTLLVGARSGTPTAAAPVEEGRLVVENVDARTLRLTWLDRPGDNALALSIARSGAGLDLVLVQPEHDLDGDAILHDRVLILAFSEGVRARDVVATLRTEPAG